MTGYRKNEPTSKAAMLKMIESGALSERRAQVYRLVSNYPGKTSAEYSRLMIREYPRLPIHSAVESPHKRLTELYKLGHVRHGPNRKCTETGNDVITWFISNVSFTTMETDK